MKFSQVKGVDGEHSRACNASSNCPKKESTFVRLRPDGSSRAFRRGAVDVEQGDGVGQRRTLAAVFGFPGPDDCARYDSAPRTAGLRAEAMPIRRRSSGSN